MNIHSFFNRGIALSGAHERKEKALTDKRDNAVAMARAKWLNALLVDETRAWMALGEKDHGALTGLTTVLTLAGAAKAFDDGNEESPTVRIIRGALSAAAQCAESASGRISVQDARAFHSAAKVAGEAIASCTTDAILHAAVFLQRIAGTTA